MGADFYRVVEQVKKVLGANPLVMTMPIGREDEFVGVVDVLTRQAFYWDDSVCQKTSKSKKSQQTWLTMLKNIVK